MSKDSTSVIERTDQKVKKPSMFSVILLNDHYTTMEFVVLVLEKTFNKSKLEAEKIMLEVHNNGSGQAGIYVKEIAETKVNEVHKLAISHEHPLKCIMREAG